MDWRYWIAEVLKVALAILAGANGGALYTGGMQHNAEALYALLPLAGSAGAAWYASGRAAVQAKDRSLEIMAELVRELTAQGRLQNVTSTGVKFAVEFKQEPK